MVKTVVRQQPRAHRRSAVLVSALVLALASGVALVGAGLAVTDPVVIRTTASEPQTAADLARAFYAALGEAIARGETAALDALVAPDVAWCPPCPGRAATRDDLKAYLADLHRTAPDTRLAADAVVAADRETATVRVRVTGSSLAAAPAPWGPVDTLRIAGGRIVERRAGPDGLSLAAPLLGARLAALPSAATGVVLARLTFAPGGGAPGLRSAGPTLLVVESGQLTLHSTGGGRVLRAGGTVDEGDGGEAATPGPATDLVAVLRQGDAAIVPAGVRHDLTEPTGAGGAVALGATLSSGDDGHGHPSLDRGTPPFAPALVPGGVPFPPLDHPLPVVHVLASGTVAAWPDGPVRVGLGRVVLGPGARVAPAAAETALAAVDAGTLVAVGAGDRTVGAGGGLLAPAGTVREFRNAGPGVLVLLVVTVAPAPT